MHNQTFDGLENILELVRFFLMSTWDRTVSSWFGITVIRFGEISPLRQIFKNIWQTFEGLFCVWKIFDPTLAFLNIFGKFELM